jgi:hypothetical protein
MFSLQFITLLFPTHPTDRYRAGSKKEKKEEEELLRVV